MIYFKSGYCDFMHKKTEITRHTKHLKCIVQLFRSNYGVFMGTVDLSQVISDQLKFKIAHTNEFNDNDDALFLKKLGFIEEKTAHLLQDKRDYTIYSKIVKLCTELYDNWCSTKDDKIRDDIIHYNEYNCNLSFYLIELIKNQKCHKSEVVELCLSQRLQPIECKLQF